MKIQFACIALCSSWVPIHMVSCSIREWDGWCTQYMLDLINHRSSLQNASQTFATYNLLLVMGDISILYRYCFVFLDIRSIDLISKSRYFDTILHVIFNGFRWPIIIIIMQFMTSKVTNKFSVCFHYSNCQVLSTSA